MNDQDKTKEQLIRELVELRRRVEHLESLPLLADSTCEAIRVSNIDIAWNARRGTCTFEALPVAMMWIDTTLAGLMSGVQQMVGTERFGLALQSEGRNSVEADWKVIEKFPNFREGFRAVANVAAVAGWGEWELVSHDELGKTCRFRVRNSWEGRYQKALGVCWGSGMLAGKLAGYSSRLFGTNCWAEQSAFIAKGDEFDEFIVSPSERSVEQEIENLLASDEATRADLAVALEKLRDELTERSRMERELPHSEEKYRSLVENAPVGIISVDPDGRIAEVNGKLLEILGSPSVDATKAINILTFPPLVDAGLSEKVRACMEEARPVEAQLPYTSKWGKESYLRVLLRPTNDPVSDAMGCQAVVEDVTAEKRAEAALQYHLDLQRLVTAISTRILYPSDDEYRREGEALYRDLESGAINELDVRLKRKDGSMFEGAMRLTAFDPFDLSKGVIVTCTDISDRKRAEEERLRLATAIEQSAESIVITDPDGTIQYVNPAFERTTGYTRELAVGQNPRILKSGKHSPEFYNEMWTTLTSGNVWTGHLINKKKDGTRYDEEGTISPVKDESGKIVNYVAVKRDVTTQILLEKQLQQAQKMEAIGTLAGGVAHDFNNLLQVVLGYADMLLMAKKTQDPDREKLLAIRKAAKDGGDLVKGLLTFGRKVGVNPRPADLNQVVKRVREMLYRTIPKMIEIRLFLANDLKTINADPGQMEQVLLNLAVNARDAISGSGTLTIETENVSLTKEYCETHLELEPGEYVLLSVSDTGYGMKKEVVEHIFEPFFTTKRAGEGTGLGLAMVYGIVKSHHGHIACYSEPGIGTTFKIHLPAIVEYGESEADLTQEMPSFGTETLLLVDDEERVRKISEIILTRSGYKVLTAGDGKEALEVYRRNKEQISLVVLDLIMPEMGGKQCLDGLLKIDPGVKVLVASGYSVNGPTDDALEAGAVDFIRKPFDARNCSEWFGKCWMRADTVVGVGRITTMIAPTLLPHSRLEGTSHALHSRKPRLCERGGHVEHRIARVYNSFEWPPVT